jgi:chemotaxis protein CheZ
MKMNDIAHLPAVEPSTPAAAEVFLQLGAITRQLHDALGQLGVIPQLQMAAHNLPDAKSRLNYIAQKTGDAANKVLNSVDQAKAEHALITTETRRIAAAIVSDPVKAVASGTVMNFVGDVERSTARIDQHLTDIMLAQDFHDLTSQVVAKIVAMAGDLEASLVKLLVQAAPPEAQKVMEHAKGLNGPVVDPKGRTDVVSSQGEVDDLLASLGF